MSEHRVHAPLGSVSPGDRLRIGGDEAQHAARVKRLAVHDTLTVLDGRGRSALARIVKIGKDARAREWELEVSIDRVQDHPRPGPRVEVWSAVPKGGRLDDMVDQLAQIGVDAWAPLRAERSVAGATEHKAERLRRIVVESAKQCGRPWLMELEAGGEISDALRSGAVVFADAAGTPFNHRALGDDARAVRILIGPEGGWTEAETGAAVRAGAVRARFGAHAMRIETAAVAAAAIVLDRLRSPGSRD